QPRTWRCRWGRCRSRGQGGRPAPAPRLALMPAGPPALAPVCGVRIHVNRILALQQADNLLLIARAGAHDKHCIPAADTFGVEVSVLVGHEEPLDRAPDALVIAFITEARVFRCTRLRQDLDPRAFDPG